MTWDSNHVNWLFFGPHLDAASAEGYTKIVRQLLEGGADVNAQGRRDGNALYAAFARGYTEIVRQLLEHGALEMLVVRLGGQFEETGDGDELGPPQCVFPAVQFELLLGAVAGFANLTQLAVDWTGKFRNRVNSEGLDAAVPRLRYVKVRDTHWRVWRGRGREKEGVIS